MKKMLFLGTAIFLFGGEFLITAAHADSDPPNVSVGMTADQAYAAIPHRRTVWDDGHSPIPVEERAYLGRMFQVIDEAVELRVAGQQDFAAGRFDANDIVGQFDILIAYVHDLQVPARLSVYHRFIVRGLSAERKFFADWKSQRDNFRYARHLENDPDVRDASQAVRSAYGRLMSLYPNESGNNKDAFYDYHCALDFL